MAIELESGVAVMVFERKLSPPVGQLVAFVSGGEVVTKELDVFHFDNSRPSFETMAQENGFRFWLASQLMEALGYASMKPVLAAVNKAMVACAQLNVPINENFEQTKTDQVGSDFKLSRFACYLTVLNGDPKNKRIAEAQAYFITMAEAFRQYVQQADSVERVLVRGEISEREKTLSGVAHSQGVDNFAFFQNAGYRGMYNMNLAKIRDVKGVPANRSPLDYMGKTELAANLFRITQTEEKILNENIKGQQRLESAAEAVGTKVRKTMLEISGVGPESLPPARDLKQVKKDLVKAGKEYAKLDKPKSKKPK